jgi:hypothetical protein
MLRAAVVAPLATEVGLPIATSSVRRRQFRSAAVADACLVASISPGRGGKLR